MLQQSLKVTISAATVLLLSTTAMHGQTIAYDATVQTGNQGWSGNLGLDFDVNSPIMVQYLGAFDANGDGFTGTIKVAIFNRRTAAPVTPALTFTGATGTLMNGDRFLALPEPVNLPAGHYSVVAVGFSNADKNGNSKFTSFIASTENTGGGLVSFGGTGRYDAKSTLGYPATVPPGLPSNVFLAGTFQFTGSAQASKAPALSVSFASPSGGSINLGEMTSLAFTIQNQDAALTHVGFADPLPEGLMIATPNGLTGSCHGGTITAEPGAHLINLGDATLAAGASCTFSVNLMATAAGTQNTTTSQITSNEAAPGAAASAGLFVNGWIYWFLR